MLEILRLNGIKRVFHSSNSIFLRTGCKLNLIIIWSRVSIKRNLKKVVFRVIIFEILTNYI